MLRPGLCGWPGVGPSLTGLDGALKQLAKSAPETVLNEEMNRPVCPETVSDMKPHRSFRTH